LPVCAVEPAAVWVDVGLAVVDPWLVVPVVDPVLEAPAEAAAVVEAVVLVGVGAGVGVGVGTGVGVAVGVGAGVGVGVAWCQVLVLTDPAAVWPVEVVELDVPDVPAFASAEALAELCDVEFPVLIDGETLIIGCT
jgi:hypothetical protein